MLHFLNYIQLAEAFAFSMRRQRLIGIPEAGHYLSATALYFNYTGTACSRLDNADLLYTFEFRLRWCLHMGSTPCRRRGGQEEIAVSGQRAKEGTAQDPQRHPAVPLSNVPNVCNTCDRCNTGLFSILS